MRVSTGGGRGVDQATENSKSGKVEKAKGPREGRASRSSSSEGAKTDKVEVSSKARDAAKAKSIAESAPDVREDKVAKLRDAVKSGTYKVDADAIADRMVDDHISMN